MKYKTETVKPKEIERKWHIVDLNDQVLGRVSTKIAQYLQGKHKAQYSANVDCGDYVIVINAAKVRLSSGKEEKKEYFHHTGYLGNSRTFTFNELMKKNPELPISESVKNMLPKNKHRDGRMARLFVYADANHKHAAQKPESINL